MNQFAVAISDVQSILDHGYKLIADHVEICIKVHLNLVFPGVLHNNDVIGAVCARCKNLGDRLLIRAQTLPLK